LDVRLPGRSGVDLQAALRRQGNALPVVFLTGYADGAAIEQRAGSAVLHILLHVIKALLRQSSGANSASVRRGCACPRRSWGR